MMLWLLVVVALAVGWWTHSRAQSSRLHLTTELLDANFTEYMMFEARFNAVVDALEEHAPSAITREEDGAITIQKDGRKISFPRRAIPGVRVIENSN
jgi:hypothetical protein